MDILLLSSDLMLGSQLEGSAQQAGFVLRDFSKTDDLLAAAANGAQLVILDLSCPAARQGLEELVVQLRAIELPPTIWAFGPHVQEHQLERAREAGCDEVLTRGQIHRESQMRFQGLAK